MKKFVLSMLLVVGLAGLAFAAAEWQENGVKVNKSEKLNFVGGPDVSGNGTVTDVDFSTMTGDITVTGSLTTDGTIYTATIMTDGAIYAARATVDPCATLGAGYIFFNDTTGVPCYCDNSNVDRAIYSATTSCF